MEYRILDLREVTHDELTLWYAEADPDKRRQFDRLRRPEDRKRSLCADHLARAMLCKITGLSPETLRFSRAANGKPIVSRLPYHFNVTHSGSFAACAVDTAPVGIDLETPRPFREALAKRVCCPQEEAFLYPDGRFDEMRFLELWTVKEAYMKYTGTGLACDWRSICAVHDGVLALPTLALLHRRTAEYTLSLVYEKPLDLPTETVV